jgi:uncharacterized protein YueI
MLNDNYCPWPNKDDFCKAWKPSKAWLGTYEERLNKVIQRACTWEKMVCRKEGTRELEKFMKEVEESLLFIKEAEVNLACALQVLKASAR